MVLSLINYFVKIKCILFYSYENTQEVFKKRMWLNENLFLESINHLRNVFSGNFLKYVFCLWAKTLFWVCLIYLKIIIHIRNVAPSDILVTLLNIFAQIYRFILMNFFNFRNLSKNTTLDIKLIWFYLIALILIEFLIIDLVLHLKN